MTQFDTRDLRAWALKGAEQRLVEIAAEAAAIHGAFPELRNVGGAQGHKGTAAGAKGKDAAATRSAAGKRARKGGGMSAAMRKAVGERMRKYWAARRAAAQQDAQGSDRETSSGEPVEGTESAAQHDAAGDTESTGRTSRKSSRGRKRTAGAQGAKRSGRRGRTASRAAKGSARG